MATKYNFLGKEITGKFTIPSGIITTSSKTIKKVAQDIPEIGVITTKSIGPSPRLGHREPIMTQYAPGCFMNAVGLTNPGADEFAKQLKELRNNHPNLLKNKFLLTSIFGGTIDEYVKVAKLLAPYSDGLELNLSCPNAKGLGIAMGQDPAIVKEITQKVKNAVSIPVIPKLTPNVPNIGEIAVAAVEGGADAICAINTVGPGSYTVEGNPVLTNTKGGMSGKSILPIGLGCVNDIKIAFKKNNKQVPIIATGGICKAKDIEEYKHAGGNIFAIGSALIGLTSPELVEYFKLLEEDTINKTNNAFKKLKHDIDMSFTKYKLVDNTKTVDDFSILTFDNNINIKAGEFIFIWIPGKGEKPFSVLDNNPLKLAIQERGCFTKELVKLELGTECYIRGPYGTSINPKEHGFKNKKKVILVAGGSGLAAVYQFAKDFSKDYEVEIFFGARSKQHLYFTEECKLHGNLHISTNDGSFGNKGFVTDSLNKWLKDNEEINKEYDLLFFNCGPEVMIDASTNIQIKYTPRELIFNSIEYLTKCGVGICGACSDRNGKRICVDGPFIKEEIVTINNN